MTAFVIAALALAAVACGGGGDETTYSPEVESNFMRECVDGALDAGNGALEDAEATKYCTCSYDRVRATVPFEEFAAYDDEAREDESTPLPPEFEAASTHCRTQLGYTSGIENFFIAECRKSATAGSGAMSAAQAREYCGCAFAELKASVPYAEFVAYDTKVRKDPSAPAPPKIAAAIERCAVSAG